MTPDISFNALCGHVAAERVAPPEMLRELRMRAAMEAAGYDLKALIRALPVRDRLDLIDAIASDLAGDFYGADRIGLGVDEIREELREEDAENARRGRA